jgi:hypothetical protein
MAGGVLPEHAKNVIAVANKSPKLMEAFSLNPLAVCTNHLHTFPRDQEL